MVLCEARSWILWSLRISTTWDSMILCKKKKKKNRHSVLPCVYVPYSFYKLLFQWVLYTFSLPENFEAKFFQILLYSYTYLYSISGVTMRVIIKFVFISSAKLDRTHKDVWAGSRPHPVNWGELEHQTVSFPLQPRKEFFSVFLQWSLKLITDRKSLLFIDSLFFFIVSLRVGSQRHIFF